MLYWEKVVICSEINIKHTNTVWAECKILECLTCWCITWPVGFKRWKMYRGRTSDWMRTGNNGVFPHCSQENIGVVPFFVGHDRPIQGHHQRTASCLSLHSVGNRERFYCLVPSSCRELVPAVLSDPAPPSVLNEMPTAARLLDGS